MTASCAVRDREGQGTLPSIGAVLGQRSLLSALLVALKPTIQVEDNATNHYIAYTDYKSTIFWLAVLFEEYL